MRIRERTGAHKCHNMSTRRRYTVTGTNGETKTHAMVKLRHHAAPHMSAQVVHLFRRGLHTSLCDGLRSCSWQPVCGHCVGQCECWEEVAWSSALRRVAGSGTRHNKNLDKSTMHAVAAASRLPGLTSLDLLVSGKGCGAVAQEASAVEGVTKVLLAESDDLEHQVADTMSEFLLALQAKSQYTVIAGPASSSARDSLPRVAAKLDVQPVSDIISVESEDGVFVRPTYAGNAIARVKTSDAVRVLTFRPTAFEPSGVASSAAPVESVQTAAHDSTGTKWLSESVKASDKPQLGSASRVVSGGRALQSSENFENVLEPLCDKLTAAMGASRAAVDAGYVPNELQVGQTGKVVAPELYVAVGISGAIQHLAGMKDSKTIVAVNKDPDAPIFQVADYGLVGDLFEIVPELTKKL